MKHYLWRLRSYFRQVAGEAELSHHQRAILTVAHRLSTAREADRVIVIDNGRILEMGTPEALIRKGGRFAALLELEAAGWDWRNGEVDAVLYQPAG